MSKLKDHAITLYESVINYIKCVVDGLPLEKMTQPIEKGEKPAELLFHLVATPNMWMKRAERPFDFRAKFETIEEAVSLLERQLATFKAILENPDEVHYTPTTSIPWIMIRSASHMMHHAAMLVYIRHMWGLPPLAKGNGWGKIVDLGPILSYT